MEETVILLVLLSLSAFFSASETAMVSVPLVRVESLLKEGRTGAYALYHLKSNTDRMLITILVGNTVVNSAATAVATVAASEMFSHVWSGVAVGALTLVILIFGEISPKTYAARHAVVISLALAPLLYSFSRLAVPLVWVLEKFTRWLKNLTAEHSEPIVTESELLSLAQHGADEGSIEEDEHKMIQRIFDFNDLCAEDIMIPRNKIIAMNGNQTIQESLIELTAQPHSRVPLHNGQLEGVSKVVYLRDVMAELAQGNVTKTLFDCAREPRFVHENERLDDLLLSLREQKRQLILVVDDLGLLQGVFTIEDMLEELVGEIYDVRERPAAKIVEGKDGGICVNGDVEVRELEYYFDIELGGKPTDSVNQWILNKVGRIPKPEEWFSLDGLVVLVERASPRTIHRVRITPEKGLLASQVTVHSPLGMMTKQGS